jgi:hypothetical protein
MEELSAYIGGHMFAEWWAEPDYIVFALADVVCWMVVVVIELEGVLVSGVFECLLIWWYSGFELVLITGDVR